MAEAAESSTFHPVKDFVSIRSTNLTSKYSTLSDNSLPCHTTSRFFHERGAEMPQAEYPGPALSLFQPESNEKSTASERSEMFLYSAVNQHTYRAYRPIGNTVDSLDHLRRGPCLDYLRLSMMHHLNYNSFYRTFAPPLIRPPYPPMYGVRCLEYGNQASVFNGPSPTRMPPLTSLSLQRFPDWNGTYQLEKRCSKVNNEKLLENKINQKIENTPNSVPIDGLHVSTENLLKLGIEDLSELSNGIDKYSSSPVYTFDQVNPSHSPSRCESRKRSASHFSPPACESRCNSYESYSTPCNETPTNYTTKLSAHDEDGSGVENRRFVTSSATLKSFSLPDATNHITSFHASLSSTTLQPASSEQPNITKSVNTTSDNFVDEMSAKRPCYFDDKIHDKHFDDVKVSKRESPLNSLDINFNERIPETNAKTDFVSAKCSSFVEKLSPKSHLSSRLYTLERFCSGSLIYLANGHLCPIERLSTDDFMSSSGEISPDFAVTVSEITHMRENHERGTIIVGFFLQQRQLQVTVGASVDHPFFVYHKGWSSYNPSLTQIRYRLTCRSLSIGDRCMSIVHRKSSMTTTHNSDTREMER